MIVQGFNVELLSFTHLLPQLVGFAGILLRQPRFAEVRVVIR